MMRKRKRFAGAVLAIGLFAGGVCELAAQDAGSPPVSASQPASSAPAPAAKDKSAKADPAAASVTPAKKASTADDNPFPEDVSKQAAATAKTETTGDLPGTPAPSATGKQGSSSLDNTDKLGLDDPRRTQLKVQSPDGSADIYDPKRATEDVRVGKFYLKMGDFKGAYDRFKDAASFDHEDVEAIFWLAEAAQKMNLTQEAVQNYQLYLDALPDGPNAKTARKALGGLASVRKP